MVRFLCPHSLETSRALFLALNGAGLGPTHDPFESRFCRPATANAVGHRRAPTARISLAAVIHHWLRMQSRTWLVEMSWEFLGSGGVTH